MNTRPERAVTSGRTAVRAARLACGWALLSIGGVLLVLPGPGIPLVLGGLSLLAPEVPWAHRMRSWLRQQLDRARQSRRR